MENTGLNRSEGSLCATQCHLLTDYRLFVKSSDDMPPEKFLQSMIGYHLTYENSLCGMAMTQGRQRQVINIGLGIKQLAIEPRGGKLSDYVESSKHKVCLSSYRDISFY